MTLIDLDSPERSLVQNMNSQFRTNLSNLGLSLRQTIAKPDISPSHRIHVHINVGCGRLFP